MRKLNASTRNILRIIYVLFVITLICGAFYHCFPHYYFRDIKLHITKEDVLSIEQNKHHLTPSINEGNTITYENITISPGVTAYILYTFTNNHPEGLKSINVLIPMDKNKPDDILSYLRSTFPKVKKDTNFTLQSALTFHNKATTIYLYPSEDINKYCITIDYRYAFFFQ